MSDTASADGTQAAPLGETAVADTGGTAPTTGAERIASLDIVRGVAVLGILILNSVVMGLSYSFAINPGFFGPPESGDYWAWFISSLLFEGTFRAIFGMLFGAGVYLFMSRVEARFGPGRARGLHLRRSGWLIVLGLVDTYILLWYGDILFLYGVMGLVLWLFRRLSVRALVIWAVVFAAISALLSLGNGYQTEVGLGELAAYEARVESGETPSAEDTLAYEGLREAMAFAMPSPEGIASQAESVRGSYSGAAAAYWAIAVMMQTVYLGFFGFWDSAITMLLGMALFKTGFLKGAASTRGYMTALLVGYGVAVPLRLWHLGDYAASDFDMVVFTWNSVWYDVERIAMAFGHLGLLFLLIRSGRLPLTRALAATGRMALTNYLMQSVIGLAVFVGLGGYLAVSRVDILAGMVAVWAFQLWFSLFWLARYRFGPAEWLWRSLTYWRVQPLRRQTLQT
ncbi:DUF418 domain-containing protein [Eilatimonas milleporae]|uniref:DUF418 domain-containing protein n=1 Tax=Eilatimonas milleporae TaxID=911205 RepID=A0A3M0C6Z1_9PROT|nr:DUF418 domain-containing protein [Eilatimonas milleporae]RMB04675.1 uncharacterized protein BXY39_2946 [Eilatimonas milleporae]